MDKKMMRMLKRHHVFTLATAKNNIPWCASCFYVFFESGHALIFTSDKNTRHIAEASRQHEVAGAIALETRIIGRIRGIQFSGILTELAGEDYLPAKRIYLKRFPYASPFIGDTSLWKIELTHLKMTDNRLGFGKKIIWSKNA